MQETYKSLAARVAEEELEFNSFYVTAV